MSRHQLVRPSTSPGSRFRSAGGHRAVRPLVAVALGLLAACSAATRYSVLSFLFNGVPPPEAGAEEPLGPPESTRPIADAAATDKPPLPPPSTVHRPYAEGRCDKCHASREGKPAQLSSIFQGVPMLLQPVEKLCLQCHKIEQKRFLHAPAISGQCVFCHEPHRSPTHHMLLMPTTPELCARCHSGATFLTAEAHAAYGQRECVECHDPHAADFEFNLLPGVRDGSPQPRKPTVSRPKPGEW